MIKITIAGEEVVCDKNITINEENKYFKMVNGVLLDINETKIITYLQTKNNEHYYYVIEDYKGKNAMDKGYISIGEFLQMTIKLMPGIELRYKGLGELSETDMWMTVMNPETRTLIQLTVDDIEKACETFDTLHGKGKTNADNRRKLTDTFEINMEMLDN